ncbi:hypothetical protein H072_10858 [Dactylellina haptotyla CBS 200.50]|uniref:PNK FHA domain-containing protein n=1 Tax=Dactylellina haptotyla (strain CBS 200.50) TaxID=1284197 RepID=S8BKD4_DACHA|nr:hypothetical protein H072_10858 [Dactylellina haptotyla CBS 200.50]
MASRSKRKVRQETPERDDGSGVSPPPVKRPNAGTAAAAAAASSSAIASFFTPISQKASPIEFSTSGSLLFASWSPLASAKATASVQVKNTTLKGGSSNTVTSLTVATEISKVTTKKLAIKGIKFAGFDLDSNLIATKSGNKFGKDGEDWKWWHPEVPKRLRGLSNDGYQIVIFTNQNGLKASGSKSETKVKEFKKKMGLIASALGLPLRVYAATESDQYRKPRTGMFERYLQDLGDDAPMVDLDNSMFVGDAAGRKGDFSSSDREFAEGMGVKFLTPEELFLGSDPEPFDYDINPASFTRSDGGPDFKKKYPVELVLLCGRPGAGKSTLTTRYLEPLGYKRVNQDILKTKDKCIRVAEGYLKEGESVVIDATNASKETRAEWGALAKKVGDVAFRCIYLSAPEILCKHNDAVRSLSGVDTLNPDGRSSLPDIAFRTFKSKFQEPEEREGFKDITVVDFEFRGTDAEYGVWKKHWI